MRVAVPIWSGRVSPVFDVARRLVLLDTDGAAAPVREEMFLGDTDFVARARQLGELGVDVLICGAISRPLEQLLLAAGIKVVSQTCGSVDEVLGAYRSGLFTGESFLMPGCRRRGCSLGRRRGRGCRGTGRRL